MLFDNIDDNIQEIITRGDFIKKETNKITQFSTLWRNEFAPSNHIGHNNKLLHKYGILRVYGDYNEKLSSFIKSYLEDSDPTFNYKKWSGSKTYGRSVKQIECIANHILRRCSEQKITFFNGMTDAIENIMCLILNHACAETLAGKYGELIVEEYFNSFGYIRDNQTDTSDSVWDTNGVDILLYNDNKIFRFVQVKPISFMMGNKLDLVTDRKKCIEQNQPFIDDYIQLHYLETHEKIRSEIIYCFYNEKYNFINFNGDNSDNGVFITYSDFANVDGTTKYTQKIISRLQSVNLRNFKKKVKEGYII